MRTSLAATVLYGIYIADTFWIMVHPEICASVEFRTQPGRVSLHVAGSA
jgi:hypothetical protein